MTRRQALPRWSSLLLIGLSMAGLLITAILPNALVDAGQKQRLGWLVTRVVDRNGQPVDAIVVIQGAQNRAGRTDGQGRYVVAVPPGRYLVSAVFAGQATPSRSMTVLPGRTRQTTIALSVSGGPTSPVAGNRKLPAPTPSGVSTSQTGGGTGQTLGALLPPGSTISGSKQEPESSSSNATAKPTEPAPSAAVDSALAGSAGSPHSQGSRPAKLKALKASPTTTQPGGSSTIDADVSNPDNLALTFSWQASGGNISGTGTQARWVAPPSTGQFTIALTIKDQKGRTSSGTVAVYAQAGTTPAKIAGQVTDTFGAALAGASVVGAGPQSWSVITDASGNYLSPDLTDGSYSVTASLSGYSALTHTANAVSGSTVVVNFALSRTATTGRIGGRITDAATATGIQGATVSGSGPQAWSATTDASGFFTSPDLPTGTYIVLAAKSGYGSVSKSVSVAAGALATANFVLSQTPPAGTRDPALWPFLSTDPWNYPIGTGAVLVPPSGVAFSEFGQNADYWSVPVFKATLSDPIRNVRATGIHPTLLDPLSNVDSNAVTVQFRIPDNAVAAKPNYPNGDNVLVILDADGRYFWEMYKARKDTNGVDWVCDTLVKNDLEGNGAGFPYYHGIRGSGVSVLGGLIRAGELANGIKHAIAVVADPAYVAKGVRWPASASDGTATTTNIYESTLLVLPSTINISSFGMTSPKAIAVAMAFQNYGAYIIDRGYVGTGLTFMVEYTARAEQLSSTDLADLKKIVSSLRIVSNNSPTTPGGGGTPLVPLAPPFAQLNSFGGHVAATPASNPRRAPDTAIPLAASIIALLPLDHLRRARRD